MIFGYFSTAIFESITQLTAFWLRRIPANLLVTMDDGSSLEDKFKKRSNKVIDEIVYVSDERTKCRLVAVRADDKLVAKRRRLRRKNTKKKPSQQALHMKEVFNTVSNFDHYESLIYAALIFQLITLHVAAHLKIGERTLSLENFSKCVDSQLLELNRDIATVFSFDSRHILMEKRKRLAIIDLLITT